MNVTLNDTIPPNVKRRYGWAIKHNARLAKWPSFDLSLTPPMRSKVGFNMPLSTVEETSLRVQFIRIPIKRRGDIVGWAVGMDAQDARLAMEFIEKHWP